MTVYLLQLNVRCFGCLICSLHEILGNPDHHIFSPYLSDYSSEFPPQCLPEVTSGETMPILPLP